MGGGGGGGGGGSSFVAAGATGVSGPALASSAAQVTITYAVPAVGQSATVIGFATQPHGTVSTEQTLTVTNEGSAPLVVSSVVLGGADPGDYMINDRCQQPVPPGASGQVGVRFAPQKQGASSASLTLLTNAPSAPAAVALSGTGGPPVQNPAGPTPGTISQGAAGPTVRWAQYLLVIVGKTLGDKQIDGVFGPVTRSAVEQFQRAGHLAVDGIVGPATWAALGGGGAQPPTLAEGSQGPVVQRLQSALNQGRGGFAPGSNPVLATDGIYGPQTAAAVKGAQQSGGIGADGVVGLQTWALPVHGAGQVLADLCGVGPVGG